MAILKICLAKKFGYDQGFGEGDMYLATQFMLGFFNDVIKGTSKFDACGSFTEPSSTMVGAQDLVCYLLADSAHSILVDKGYLTSSQLGGTGTTYFPSGKAISEIYMDMVSGQIQASRLLANIVIHELMHNKLDADPDQTVQDVHTIAGGRVSKHKSLTPSDTPSSQDVQAMRSGIGLSIVQYTSGL